MDWTLNPRERVTGQDGGSESTKQVERLWLVPLKDCNHASLASKDESQSRKAVVGKSGCRALARALMLGCYYDIRPCICSQSCLSLQRRHRRKHCFPWMHTQVLSINRKNVGKGFSTRENKELCSTRVSVKYSLYFTAHPRGRANPFTKG